MEICCLLVVCFLTANKQTKQKQNKKKQNKKPGAAARRSLIHLPTHHPHARPSLLRSLVCPLTVGCCRSCRWSSSLGDWASWVACLSRSSSPRHDCQYRCRRHSLPRLGAHESARDDRQPPTADSRTLDNLNLKYTHTQRRLTSRAVRRMSCSEMRRYLCRRRRRCAWTWRDGHKGDSKEQGQGCDATTSVWG